MRKKLALAIALAALAGPVSPASATTSSHAQSYLHFPPWQSRGQCLPVRVLQLNGSYRWRAYTVHWAHRGNPFWEQRVVRLRGTYSWFVCRDHLAKGYRIRTNLTNQATGGAVDLAHYQYGGVYGDGTYDWGSTLDRVGPF